MLRRSSQTPKWWPLSSSRHWYVEESSISVLINRIASFYSVSLIVLTSYQHIDEESFVTSTGGVNRISSNLFDRNTSVNYSRKKMVTSYADNYIRRKISKVYCTSR